MSDRLKNPVHNELTYRMCYEHTLEGILLTNPNGTVLAANPAACEIFGMTEAEIYTSARSVLFDITDPNFEKLQSERRLTGSVRGDLTLIRKNGTRFIAEISSRIFTTDKGEQLTTIIILDKTEKIAAEQKIREAEQRYRQIVELAKEGIWVTDGQHKTTYVNDSMAAMLGYERDEMQGMELFDFMDDADRENSKDLLYGRKNGIKEQFDFVFLKKDGTKVWVIISTTPILKDGIYAGAMALITDITQRKIAEANALASEIRFRELVENSTDLTLLLDKNLLTVYRSPATFRIMGFTDEERIGRSYLELAHPDDVKKIIAFQKIVINNPGKPIPINVRAKNANGHYLWLEGIATNLMHNSSVNAIVVNLRDISERKKAEEITQRLNRRLRIATEAANVCIWEWDIVTQHVEWDEAMYKLYGLNPAEFSVNFDSWLSQVHPDDIKRVLQDSDDAKAGLRPLDTGFRIYRSSDSALRYIHSKALNVTDPKTGEVIKMIGSNWDITAQILAKEEKEKILTDLIRRNSDLEQFAYIISHNLRAPVSNVLSLTDMLVNNDFDDESKPTILTGLDMSSKKIDHIINDLNEIFQSRQHLNDKKEPVFLQRLVDDIKFSISNLIKQNDVTLRCDFREIDHINTVHSYLYSIFYNLILNSIKYRREDTDPVINISAKTGDYKIVKIMVADNGKGIDLKKYKKRLFGLYQRFDQTVEGRGLGLYMVKTQVEALGGTIQVESNTGKGTSFEITIPL